ncbi:universal stress protein [Zafaria cholistanensis]|uniref:universal stress protein n=1 Tax=Zafaria cholistanensis TaxID=1682741 RepID=UPI002804ADC5|nr:universal stress protein [Zafaria cholistanensis]
MADRVPPEPVRRVPGPLVVGVIPNQHPEVVLEARALSQALGRPIIFAYVEPGSYLVEWNMEPDTEYLSLHPREMDGDIGADVALILANLWKAMEDAELPWRLRVLAGDPARALARLARESRASMIIVGTREPGVGPMVSEFLGGSTAAHLAEQQTLPVLVVPVAATE